MSTVQTVREWKAYKSDPELKRQFVEQLQWHRDQDRIVSGSYGNMDQGDDFMGCHIGCSIHSIAVILKKPLNTGDHQLLEDLVDFPLELNHLCDSIFETLPAARRKEFPVQVGIAIRPGADLKMVVPQFIYWMLQNTTKPENEPPAVTEYVEAVTDVYADWTVSNVIPPANADLAYRADLADLAYLAYRADLAYHAYLAYLAYRADRAYHAYLVYRADLAYLVEKSADKLIELLEAA